MAGVGRIKTTPRVETGGRQVALCGGKKSQPRFSMAYIPTVSLSLFRSLRVYVVGVGRRARMLLLQCLPRRFDCLLNRPTGRSMGLCSPWPSSRDGDRTSATACHRLAKICPHSIVLCIGAGYGTASRAQPGHHCRHRCRRSPEAPHGRSGPLFHSAHGFRVVKSVARLPGVFPRSAYIARVVGETGGGRN